MISSSRIRIWFVCFVLLACSGCSMCTADIVCFRIDCAELGARPVGWSERSAVSPHQLLVKSNNIPQILICRKWKLNISKQAYLSTYKFKRAFFRHDRRTAPKFGTHVWIETRLALTKRKFTNPTPEGFRGYLLMFVGGWDVAWFKPVIDRKLLERLRSPSPKSQVMFGSAFSWIGDFFQIFGIHIFQVMASLVNLV